MDPFNEDLNSSGGEFYFNLGNVSEDLLRDEENHLKWAAPMEIMMLILMS